MLNKAKDPLQQAASTSAAAAGATRLEVVTFKLGEEEYGIDIQKVQELRGYDAVTR
ncbi:CheW-like domain, partial [Variovorax sp. NFACC28]